MRATALALCAVCLLGSRVTQAQLLVDPLEVVITTAGSGRVLGSFSVNNSSDSPVQATITRQDWDRREDGENRFLPAGSTGSSCGNLLSVSPLSIRVEPHTSRIVRLAVANGASLRKECWDIFFVEELPRRAAVKGNSLQFLFRTGVKVYVAPAGLKADGAIEDMSVVQPARTEVSASSTARPSRDQIAVNFHNLGGTHLLAKGRLEYRRLDNTLAMEVPITEFPTLPGATRRLTFDVPNGLGAGDYVVLALIDFGGAELVAGQIEYRAR